MLLDVIKQKEKERQEGYLQELEKYNSKSDHSTYYLHNSFYKHNYK